MTVDALTLARAAAIVREATRDKSYQDTPLGRDAAAYLRAKRKRLTDASYRRYETVLDKLARDFPDLTLTDFEPPVGTERLEWFMDEHWRDHAQRTYNTNLSVLKDFFRHVVRRGYLTSDPAYPIERAKPRGVYRETFSGDQVRRIIASQDELRDRIACRLLLVYGLRKGSLRSVQFKHFDHVRRRVTIFAKGGKVRYLPIPDVAFWHDLERHILDTGAEPHWFLMPQRPRGGRIDHTKGMSEHRAHDWWYECLERAGTVAKGQRKGEKMHKARHTAGQMLLDHTKNLKAVQMLLGHEQIATTGDVYIGWDEERLAADLASLLAEEDE